MNPYGDPWRVRCPEGHCSLRQCGDGSYCEQCDETYTELVDVKTGEAVDPTRTE